MSEFSHIPVLLPEVISGLRIRPNGIYVDGTLGGAGHSYEIAKRLTAGGRLIGLDQDADAIAAAKEHLKPFADRVTIRRNNYEAMTDELRTIGIRQVDGILLDLGVSSFQLDTAERGFSYMQEDAPLDMRMDRRGGRTAADIINNYSREELIRVLRDYGEERYASRIADQILLQRKDKPLATAGDLNKAVRAAVPVKAQMTGGHPSKKTFQAIRIETNRELDVLTDAIDPMIDLLKDHGRICIITFHSLEDRIVKNAFRRNENPCTCPPDFPVCVCGKKPKGRVVTKKPILPSEKELSENSRSRSAKLRIFERLVEA